MRRLRATSVFRFRQSPAFAGCRAAGPASQDGSRPIARQPPRMKSKSRFIRRTGTAALIAARTRSPGVLAIACSRRCLSCAALQEAVDDPVRIAAWLNEVAKAGNQGPIGQANFTEDVVSPLKGGAYKGSEDAPYIEDWCVLAGGAFTDLVLESIFGVDATLYDGLRATPRLTTFDSHATLEGLHYQGADYTASATGVRRMG